MIPTTGSDESTNRDGLPLARYAEISAHIAHFRGVAPEAVLLALGVPLAAWQAAHARWNRALATGFVNDELDVVDEFAARYTETSRRLDLERPSLDSLEPSDQPASSETTLEAAPTLSGADVLPFRSGAGLSPSFPPSPPRSVAPGSCTDETITLLPGFEGPLSLPFVRAADHGAEPHVPSMSLEQYASLCAELMVAPELRPRILVKYGVDGDDAHRMLVRRWRRVLADRPEERARWSELYHGFVRWLRRDRGFGA